jgi:hypothetical protein
MTTTAIPTQAQYHNYEIQLARAKYQEVKDSPLTDRKEAAEQFGIACANDPALIVERIRWLLDGSYGYGPMIYAKQALEARNPNPRLFYLIATYEWACGDYYAHRVWNNLGSEAQATLNTKLTAMLDEWKAYQE